jgi:TM2 domain-containing membrane protein YozV
MSNETPKYCIQCGSSLDAGAAFCKSCGAKVGGQTQSDNQTQNNQYSWQQAAPASSAYPSDKNKIAAGVLAILLGGLGVHKFYLGQIGMGILYILFCWTSIPSIIGLIEGIIYLTSTDEQFYTKYVK